LNLARNDGITAEVYDFWTTCPGVSEAWTRLLAAL